MNILHINTGQVGGAALCAMRICKALETEGIDSRMLFAEGNTMPEGIRGAIAEKDKSIWEANRFTRLAKRMLIRTPLFPQGKDKMDRQLAMINSRLEKRLYLHGPYSHYKNIARHPLVEWADIIHLHWVPDFVDYPTFFKEVRKPIVWTLHDKFPAVGVQHYCSEFNPVPNELTATDSFCKNVKRQSLISAYNLNIVAISEMMVDICTGSDVLKGFPTTMVHNGVDTNTFRPYGKHNSRKELGLPSDSTIFLFSSYNISDPNKGLTRIITALENTEISNKLLVCIGNIPFNTPLPDASFPIIPTACLNNQTKIAKYYSAADMFIHASYEEAFGQAVLESMACGTPVISTPCGISPDAIDQNNGVVCKGFSSDDIAEGIRSAMNRKYNAEAIRQYVIDNFRYEKIAGQYINLYNSILNNP